MAESEDKEMASVAQSISGLQNLKYSIASIVEDRSEYRSLLEPLTRWIESHQHSTIDPREFVQAFPTVDPRTLTKVFRLIAQSGGFRRVYKVITPKGTLPEEYSEPPVRSQILGVAEYDIIPLLVSKVR